MANASVNTWSGKTIIWNRMRGNGTEAKNMGWGTGATTGSAASNVNLFTPATEARTAGTSTQVTTSFLGDTYQVTGSIVCAGTTKAITEFALFDTTTLSPSTTNSNSMTTATTVATIGSAAGFPTTGNYYVQLGNGETVLVTAGQNTTSQTFVRAQLGSTAAVQASGSAFTLGGDGGASASSLGAQTATVAASNGGSVFCHADFPSIALAVSDSILFTLTDQLT